MANGILKQPNGKYCIFSSIVDNITHYNMSEQDIVEEYVKDYRERISLEVNQTIKKLEASNDIKDFEETMEFIKEVHGKKEMIKVRKLLTE
jgi:hypothetical protein